MKVRTLANAGALVVVTAAGAAGQEIKHFGDVWNEATEADKLELVEASDAWRNTLEPNLRLNGHAYLTYRSASWKN